MDLQDQPEEDFRPVRRPPTNEQNTALQPLRSILKKGGQPQKEVHIADPGAGDQLPQGKQMQNSQSVPNLQDKRRSSIAITHIKQRIQKSIEEGKNVNQKTRSELHFDFGNVESIESRVIDEPKIVKYQGRDIQDNNEKSMVMLGGGNKGDKDYKEQSYKVQTGKNKYKDDDLQAQQVVETQASSKKSSRKEKEEKQQQSKPSTAQSQIQPQAQGKKILSSVALPKIQIKTKKELKIQSVERTRKAKVEPNLSSKKGVQFQDELSRTDGSDFERDTNFNNQVGKRTYSDKDLTSSNDNSPVRSQQQPPIPIQSVQETQSDKQTTANTTTYQVQEKTQIQQPPPPPSKKVEAKPKVEEQKVSQVIQQPPSIMTPIDQNPNFLKFLQSSSQNAKSQKVVVPTLQPKDEIMFNTLPTPETRPLEIPKVEFRQDDQKSDGSEPDFLSKERKAIQEITENSYLHPNNQFSLRDQINKKNFKFQKENMFKVMGSNVDLLSNFMTHFTSDQQQQAQIQKHQQELLLKQQEDQVVFENPKESIKNFTDILENQKSVLAQVLQRSAMRGQTKIQNARSMPRL